MQKDKKTFIIIISTIATIATLVIINNFNMKIRLSELQTSLHKLDRNDNSVDHIALVANYELNKKVLAKKISQEEANIFEFKLHVLNSANNLKDSLVNSNFPFIYQPFLSIINFNRSILGKEPLKDLDTAKEEYKNLDLAYYFERNNYFKKALNNYEKTLKLYKFDSTLTSSILLHMGYCYALLGNHTQAEKYYTEILSIYSQESVAITATILLKYLHGFNSDYKRVINEYDSLEKSNKLYNLFAYQQALDILKNLEKKATPKQLIKIKYLKARCYSKLGEKNKAVNIYLNVAISKLFPIYSKLANKRIYAIAANLKHNKLKETSRRINILHNDQSLVEMIEHEKRVYAPELPHYSFENKNQVEQITIPKSILDKLPIEVTDKHINEFVIIKTSDGSTFKGTVKKISKKLITISSSIGIINVKKEKVINIEIEKK